MRNRIKVVYVAGSSYSGSTLLGIVLGANSKIFNLGEVSQYEKVKSQNNKGESSRRRNICTCGKRYKECKFWGKVYSKYNKDIDFNPAPGFSFLNLKLMLKILNPFSSLQDKSKQSEEYERLFQVLHNNAIKEKGSTEYLLDSSKSIYNLFLLLSAENIELKVIHLIRDGNSVVNSFKKHKTNIFYGIFSWIFVNVMCRLFIKRSNADNIKLDYERFCNNLPKELDKINKFLGTNLDSNNYKDKVRNENYHLISGNPMLNNIKGKFYEFEGVKCKKGIDKLSKPELMLTKLIITPFNKLLKK